MKREGIGVSEIIATMLLLIIAISAVALIYSQVLSDEGPAPKTIAKIVGRAEGGYIYLEHMGGEKINADNKLTYTIGDQSNTTTIKKLLEQDNNQDNEWELGEELRIPMRYDLEHLDDRIAEITGVDSQSNSIVFNGPVTLPQPVSDVNVDLDIDYTPPIQAGDEIIVTITITSSGGNVEGAGNVTVHYEIPEGLDFLSSTSPSGHNPDFDPATGYWHVGNVKNDNPAQLEITLKVGETFSRTPTQLALVLDGSGSINAGDWEMMRTGLANAINNSSILPHDGSVQLTVIQFGTYVGSSLGYSRVEIDPTQINDSTIAKNISDNITYLSQGIGGTPIAGGIYLATDQLFSHNFDKSHRQAIILVTDGVPNRCSQRPFDNYPDGPYSSWRRWCNAPQSAKNARNDALTKLDMTEDLDEFNCLAVGIEGMYGSPDVEWLNSSIAWPNPYIWNITESDSFSDPGWVASIQYFNQFGFAIEEMFKAIFSISSTASYVSSSTYDPNPDNHKVTVTIS